LNNIASFPLLQNTQVQASGVLSCKLRVLDDDKVFVLYRNVLASNDTYYAAYDTDGTVLKAPTQLHNSNASGCWDIGENDAYVHVAFRGTSGYPYGATISKANWTIQAGPTQMENIASSSNYAIARFLGSSYMAYFWDQGDNTDLMMATSSNYAVPLNISSIAARNIYYLRAASLSNGNVVVSYEDITSSSSYFQVRDQSKNEIVAETQWHPGTTTPAYMGGLVGLSNGTFAAVYRDGDNSNYPTIQYFNNDCTVAVAAATIRNADTMALFDIRADADDNVHIFFQDTADGNLFKRTVYNSSGTLVDAATGLNAMDSDDIDYENFDIDSEGNVWTLYVESVAGEVAGELDKLSPESNLNVVVSGVEVTE